MIISKSLLKYIFTKNVLNNVRVSTYNVFSENIIYLKMFLRESPIKYFSEKYDF